MTDAIYDTLAKQAATDLMPLVREFMGVLDPEGKYTVPTVQITNRSGVSWLGRCRWETYGQDGVCTGVQSVLDIQRSVLKDDNTLRRVVSHEVVHHIAVNEMMVGHTSEENNAAWKQDGGHGPKFLEVADRINKIYGAGFVTVTSDETYSVQHREVHLFVIAQRGSDSKMQWCWSTQVPQKIVDTMVEWRAMGDGWVPLILRTSDPALTTLDAKAPNWKTVEFKRELDAIVAAHKDYPNDFAMYASRVIKPTGPRAKTWTLVMANPNRFGTPRYSEHPQQINAWATPRTLTESELHMLSQLVGYGIIARHRRVKGEEELFNALKRLDFQDVASRYGHVDMETGAGWIQERLHGLWPGAKQEFSAKTAALKRTIYLDMDGVLADYERGAEKAGISLENFHATKGAFSDLELMPGAMEALKTLQATDWRVCLLSKPSDDRPEESAQEKLEWAARVLPFIDKRDIYLTDDKSKHGTKDDILVDDHPEWANAENFPGTVIKFTGPETWEEVMTTIKKTPKTAGFWDADSERYNAREDAYRAGEVQRDMRLYFNRMLNSLQVQPNGQPMTLRQFLTHNPITSLFTSTDRSVRLVGNKIRAELLAYLKQNFTPQQIQQFEKEHGTNVTDWIAKKVVAKKAVLFTKKAMFEQTPEQMTARIYVHDRDSQLAHRYGIAIQSGDTTYTFASALELIRQLDHALSSVVPASNQKRVRALRNQIVFAFGPDMEEAL